MWDTLADVYRARPQILAELAGLEHYTTMELVRVLTDPQAREGDLARVIEHGGLFDSSGRFVEVFQ